MPASSATAVGLDFEHFVDLVGDVGEPALGALDALLGARGLLAGRAQRFQRGADGAVAGGERVLGFGQAVGGFAARRLGGLDLGDQRLALLLEGGRRVGKRRALLLGFGAAGVERGDLCDRARRGARSRPAGRTPMATSRRSASSASRASACASARISASSVRLPSISERMAASLLSSSAEGGSSARPASATSDAALASSRLRDQPGLGFGQRRDARGIAGHLALGHRLQLAGVVGVALGCAPGFAGGGFGGAGCGQIRPAPLRRSCAFRRPRCAR